MKNILYLLLFFLAGSMAACFEDDSMTVELDNVADIEIGGLRDTTIQSFVGNVLQVVPEVTTGFPESVLQYAWYMADSETEGGYRTNQIADTKDLTYEVELPSGSYTLFFEVTNTETGYVRVASMALRTTTAFSQGFYILKEVDGGTDFDILAGDVLNEDVLAGIEGAPLSGAPLNLSFTYGNCYINDESQEMEGANMVHVFTEDATYRGYRVEDMKQIFNEENVRFDGLDDDEIAYLAQQGMMMIYFVTNKGVYSNYPSSMGMLSSGVYGLPAGALADGGGSPYMVPVNMMMPNYYYWNSDKHCLYYTDYNGSAANPAIYDATGVPEDELECIACGVYGGGMMACYYFFLCESTVDGARYLYVADDMTLTFTVTRLNPSLHIAQGGQVATCGRDATFLYSIDEAANEVWVYNWNEGGEFRLELPGIPEGETISYITYQYLQGSGFTDIPDEFKAIIVATETDSGYKLYIYDDLSGGQVRPGSEPQVMEGTGSVKCVRYVTTSDMSWEFMSAYDGPIVPYWN